MSATLGCFEFVMGFVGGSVLGTYKAEQLKPVYDQVAEKTKEMCVAAKEKWMEFRESQKVDVDAYK
eukprot:CAMPEP_0178996504 /NCGR_PEP_ID=MMETSP0795-20121207/8400_1 /TAXON_ID=88552 /ORGANISM="Amoebophrya sp., Strain Ameob2" /LENGTH=65 /DNA_ID=CAMNT_0020688891 /DNA_START=234 /DNA_END=431 /DNA_ORIENTATION=-